MRRCPLEAGIESSSRGFFLKAASGLLDHARRKASETAKNYFFFAAFFFAFFLALAI
jgi:hypothetical protein